LVYDLRVDWSNKTPKAIPNKRAYKERFKLPFLCAYRKYGVILRAARAVGISRDAVYDWRRQDTEFARQFDEAQITNTELLEASAIRRALRGNTALLIFLLKARKPEMYAERFRHRIENRDLSQPVGMVVSAVRRFVPEKCSNCGHDLAIRERLADELERIAASFAGAT
jgi:transposase-like protein